LNPGESEDKTIFVYDGNHTTLQLENTGTSDVVASDLTHRYLYGTAVDQILADEQVTSLSTPGDVLTPLADHLGSVRDVLDSAGTVRIHRAFNAFGLTTSQSLFNAAGTGVNPGQAGALSHLMGFTGRPFDVDSFLNWHLNRWYDTFVARWMSEDPIGFVAGDLNLYRYVGNGPSNGADPTGLLDIHAAQLLGSAMHSYSNGDYTQAISLIEKAMKIDDRHPLIYYYRGLARRAVGHNGAAMDFDHGAALEHDGVTGPPPIGQSLQRIQGKIRLELESFRQQGAAATSRWDVMFILQNSPEFVALKNGQPAIAGQFFTKFYETISRFSVTSRQLLTENLKGVNVYPNFREYRAAIRAVGRLKQEFRQLIPRAFFDDHGTDTVWFNADTAIRGRSLIPHELSHAIDEGYRFSNTPEWRKIWREEFRASPGTWDFPLHERASRNTEEAFAEYLGRLNFETKQKKRELRDNFPQAWCFLTERKLVDP